MFPLTEQEFHDYVIGDKENAVVVFSRQTCPVCSQVKSKLTSIEEELSDINFYYVDVTAAPSLVAEYDIKGVPQTMFFKGGEAIQRFAGDKDEDDLFDAAEALL